MRVSVKVILLCCVVGVLSVLVWSCGTRSSSTRGNAGPALAAPLVLARNLPPLPARPLSKEMQAVRARNMRVASDLRELPFTTGDVGMSELSGWEYGTRTREMAEILGGDELRALSKLASAGGVLPEGTDLATLAASFTAASAGATYSPLDKQVLLVGKFKGDSLLTHEFVHALQDQNFDLMNLLVVRPYDFDQTEAVFAIIEGDAMNVQRRMEEGEGYGRKSLDEITKQEGARFGEYRKEAEKLFPPLLTETFIFRYRDGARLVEAVRRKSGEHGVDELFRRPPTTSEQILHPEKYAAGEAARDVRLDEAGFAEGGWQNVTSTPLGEIGVRGLLMAGVPREAAVRAAAGWGGDRAYLFERPHSAPLFVWKIVWDKPSDAVEFFRAYDALEQQRGAQHTDDASLVGESSEAAWTDGKRTTRAQYKGDTVIIIRGADEDIEKALELAQR
jgi:hypothetical protein